MTEKLYYNESIRGLLQSIASLDPMIGPTEFICTWYDDLYFPCQQDEYLYNAGVWEKGQKEWRNCFTVNELDALEKFHKEFDLVVDLLSDDPIAFSNDPNWKKMQTAAINTLRDMGEPDA